MSAGTVQLAAKGVQDQYLTGSPQISFFNTMFTRHTPFLVKMLEVPMNSSVSSLQVCDLSRAGDVIRSITLKLTLPSMFQSGYGLAYPSSIQSPTFYYFDANFNLLASYFGRNIKPFFSTNDTNWLPPVATVQGSSFAFAGPANWIGFKDLPSALFWGFKNYTQIVNGYYIWPFTGTSEISLFTGGWVNANSNYFRYYTTGAPLKLIQKVDLVIGGQLIESVPSSYIQIFNDTNYENQQTSLSNVSGTVQTLAASDIDFYVKVPFSTTNVPAAAITNQTVEVQVTLGSLLSAIDSNSYNITNFTSKYGSFTGGIVSATYGDYILGGNGTLYQGSTPIGSMPGATAIATDFSNVYGIAGTTMYKYSGGTVSSFYIPGASAFAGALAMTAGSAGLFCYRTGLQIFNVGQNQFQSYEFPFNGYLSTNFNSYNFVATNTAIIVQNSVVPYLYTSYLYQYGLPLQISQNPLNSVYYLTANSVVKWTGSSFVQQIPISSVPNCFVVLPDRLALFYPGSIQIITAVVQNYSTSFTVISAQYVKGTTLLVGLYPAGVAIWDYTNPTVIGPTSFALSVVTSIGVGISNVYAMDAGSNLFQFSNTGTANPGQLKNIGFQNYQNYIFAFDSSNRRMYLTSNSSNSLFYLNDGGALVLNQVTPTLPSLSGLSNLYYDGQYMYSFPLNGASIAYKFNTFTDFNSNTSHILTTVKDNFGVTKAVFAGGIAFDGTNLLVAPLSSDQNVLVYNTTLPFSEPTAFYQYSGYLTGGRNYSSIATFGKNMFIGSSSLIYRYQTSPGFTVSNFQMTSYNFGAATDSRTKMLVFNSNISGNGFTVYNFGSLTPGSPTPIPGYPGNYGVLVQQNADTVFLVPKDNSNLISFSVTRQAVNSNVLLTQYPNSSNTACIAGNNLYIFPSPPWTNLFVVNLTTLAVSNIYLPINNYQGATYDGSRYIYTTNPYGNVYRYNTSTDIFNDFPGWTVSTLAIQANVVSQSTTLQGNVFFASSQNVFSTNVQTRTTGNCLASFGSQPLIARQAVGNTLFFVTASNIWQFSTNTYGSNLQTTYLLDRSLATKTPVDLTAAQSNVYVAWSDGSLGTLDLSSNDLSGIYYTVPVATAAGIPAASIIINSNVYVTTSDNVSRLPSTLNVRLADSGSGGPPSNVYSILLSTGSNLFALPSNGNVFTRISDAVPLSVDRFTSNVSNVGCALINGTTLYAFSKTSNLGVALKTTTSLATGTPVNTIISNTSANGFSCCFVGTDSNLYLLPYVSNVVVAYSIPTFNFSNTAQSQSASLTGPISNAVAGSSYWVLSQGGSLANVITGTIGGALPVADYLRGHLAYQSTPIGSNLYGFYTGAYNYGLPSQNYGTITAGTSSKIDLFVSGPGTLTPVAAVNSFFALWVLPQSNFTFSTASVTNHSWFSLTFTIGTAIFTVNGYCFAVADLVSTLNVSLAKYTTLAYASVSGSSVIITISASPAATSFFGTIGTLTVPTQSAPAFQTLQYLSPSLTTSLTYSTSVSLPSSLNRVVIIMEPGTINVGDYYWSPVSTGPASPFTVTTSGSFFNFSNILPFFANQWLATQDGSSFINTTNGTLSVVPQIPSGTIFDSLYAAGSNIIMANSTTGTTLNKYNTVTNTTGTFSAATGPVVNVSFNSPYVYVLSENSGTASVALYDQNNTLQAAISVPSQNVITSRLTVPAGDGGMVYVQSSPWANITSVSLGYTQSFDYRANWGVQFQQYSCVVAVNNTYYLLPSSGNVIIQMTPTSTSKISIVGYDVNNVFGTASTYNIVGNRDQFSNVIFTCINPINHSANLIKYSTLAPFNVVSSWSSQIQAGNISSNVSIYSAGYQLLFSNVDSNLVQYSLVGAPSPWYTYQWGIPAVASNVALVSGGNSYQFPAVASSNIVTFNVASKSFSYIAHDQPVLALANVGQYTVVVNPTKINVFQTTNMTSVTSATFLNPAGNVYSAVYDGRYLNVLAGSGRVTFDFSSLNKLSRPVYGNVYFTMVSTGTNLIATNVQTYASLGYSPRPYTERTTGLLSGLYSYQSNLYAKTSGTIQNVTLGTTVVNATSTSATDTNSIGGSLVFLSPDSMTVVNVYSYATQTFAKPSEYSSELLSDGASNLYVPSTQTLNVYRITTSSAGVQTLVAQSTYTSKSNYYVNQYFENSNLVLVTDQNQLVVFNPNPQSSAPISVASLPNQLQNNYASIIVNQNIYFFPGNAFANTVQVYNTTLPFNLGTSYSLLNIGYSDIRSLALNGTTIYGTPFSTGNFITYNTQSGTLNTYFIDTTTNVSSNGYIQSVFAGQSYFMIPRFASTVQRLFPSQLITSSSFNFPVPIITINPDATVALATYGKTLAVVTNANMYLVDMTNPNVGVISPTTSLVNPGGIGPVYFDGRFIKFGPNLLLYDTLPFTFGTSFGLSCISQSVYLSSKEVAWMQNKPIDIVLQQLQTSNVSSNGYYRMYLTGPVSEILLLGNVVTAELLLNGYSKSRLDNQYMSVLVPYWEYPRTPTSTVFSVLPLQPYVNMSRIKEQVISLVTQGPVTVMAKSFNVLRVKDGLAGLIFTN